MMNVTHFNDERNVYTFQIKDERNSSKDERYSIQNRLLCKELGFKRLQIFVTDQSVPVTNYVAD